MSVGQGTVIDLGGGFAGIVEILESVEVGFGNRSVEAHADGASDGRAEPGKDHVTSGNRLDGGADVRTRFLVGVSVVHLRHFFRGFKTAGERPSYELHGGDPFVVGTNSCRWRGEWAHFRCGVARNAEGELADGGHRLG
jgi:hypothetical protein